VTLGPPGEAGVAGRPEGTVLDEIERLLELADDRDLVAVLKVLPHPG